MKPDLRPPWIIFSDQGKPVAILPAGRPGEVADVRGMEMADVQRIVDAANSGYRGHAEEFMDRMLETHEHLLAMNERLSKTLLKP